MGYEALMKLAKEKPEWLPVVKACLDEAQQCQLNGGQFAGSWVVRRFGWLPNLRPLTRYGILKQTKTTRGGKRAYYRMPDPEGVECALEDLDSRTGER